MSRVYAFGLVVAVCLLAVGLVAPTLFTTALAILMVTPILVLGALNLAIWVVKKLT